MVNRIKNLKSPKKSQWQISLFSNDVPQTQIAFKMKCQNIHGILIDEIDYSVPVIGSFQYT